MMKLVLEDAGWTVDDKTGLGGTMICRLALLEGDIDVYMEYTGTALLVHLGHEEPITDPDLCYQTVRDEDLSQNGIVWLQPSLFKDTYTLMMRRAHAEDLGIYSPRSSHPLSRTGLQESHRRRRKSGLFRECSPVTGHRRHGDVS